MLSKKLYKSLTEKEAIQPVGGERQMSNYAPLWEAVGKRPEDSFTLTFAEIEQLLGFPLNHSFLNYKKELTAYGWEVGKISLKRRRLSSTAPPFDTSQNFCYHQPSPSAKGENDGKRKE